MAERTATTRFPASRAATRRCATALIRAVSATEVPPNFMTTVPDGSGRLAGDRRDAFVLRRRH